MDFKKILDKLAVIGGSRVLNESAKPDFLDVDKDGDKKEPMKKAVADKKKEKVAESNLDEDQFSAYDKKFKKNGKLHREDGPAVITHDGDEYWYLNGKKHREGGPAITTVGGHKFWIRNGKRHREDGPAYESPYGQKEWYLNGKKFPNEAKWKEALAGDFNAPVAPRKRSTSTKASDNRADLADFRYSRFGESKPDFLDIDKDGDKKEPMKKAVADKKVMEESASDRVTFSGKDSQGNPKHVHFGKNNGRPYHVIAGKPGTNFEASAVIPPGAKGSAGSEELMQQVANLVHSGKHNEALAQLNKHSNIKFSKGVVESVELDEAKSGAIEAHGVRGTKSTPWRKTFKSQEAFEAWLEKNEGDVEVQGTRKLDESVAESKLAECGGMSYDQDSGMSINTSIDTRTGSKTVSVTASGSSADELMQVLKLAGVGSDSNSAEQPSSSVKVVAIPMGYGDSYESEQEVDETYANEPNEQIQPVSTQMQQGTDLNRPKPMYKHGYRNGDNPMAMQEARELNRLEKEIKEGIDSIKVKQPESSSNRSAASAGSADSYYGRARKPNKSVNGVKIFKLTPEEIKAYYKAYDENEESQDFKDWGRDD